MSWKYFFINFLVVLNMAKTLKSQVPPPSVQEPPAPPLQKTLELSQNSDGCECGPQPDCSPICGKDGKTYNNDWELRCKSGKPVQKAYNGPCHVPVDCNCKVTNQPVCATDFKTYPSECWANCAKTTSPCVDVVYNYTCCFCNILVADPICASDGNEYDSFCGLECAQKIKHWIIQVCRGKCTECCDEKCTNEWNPVCVSDGKTLRTFANACLARCARKTNLSIRIVHKCECQPRVCTKEYAPVCASNGKTYGNNCEFKYAQLIDPTLRIVHNGPCEQDDDSTLQRLIEYIVQILTSLLSYIISLSFSNGKNSS